MGRREKGMEGEWIEGGNKGGEGGCMHVTM